MAYVPDEAVDRIPEISHGAWALYTYYCKRRGKDGTCWPSLDRTVADTKMRRASVVVWRRELEKAGWIEVERGKGGAHNDTSGRTVTRLLVGFGNGRGTVSVPDPVPSAVERGTAGAPPRSVPGTPGGRGTEAERGTLGVHDGVRFPHAHIRKNQPIEPAHEEKKEARALSVSSNARTHAREGAMVPLAALIGKVGRLRAMTLRDIPLDDLVRYCTVEKKARDPSSLAAHMVRHPREDDLARVCAWLERENETEDEYYARIARLAVGRNTGPDH